MSDGTSDGRSKLSGTFKEVAGVRKIFVKTLAPEDSSRAVLFLRAANRLASGPFPGASSMADNKNQHFVPQFYLRNFSSEDHRKTVGLFNLKQSKFVPRAGIKNQCTRDYWHGENDPYFEEFIRGLEGLSATAIKTAITTDRLFRLDILKKFLMLQTGRTVHSAEAFAESRRKMYELAHGRPPTQEELDPKHSIGIYLINEPLIRDLAACLVFNRTDIDFITCDNPVALSNWWFRHIWRQRPGAGVGLAQAGLEIYLPLSPRHQLILYDRNLWSVPKADQHGTINLKNKGDVLAINERQMLNAQDNVYFNSMDSAEHIEALFKECEPRRKADKVDVKAWLRDKSTGRLSALASDAAKQAPEKFMSTQPNAIDPVHRVTLFSRHFRPRFDEHPSVVGALRDLAWMEILEDFRAACRKDPMLRFTDLNQYAADHPLMARLKSWRHDYWIIAPATRDRCA
jgi:Protein of unknown function (DUF4238)